MRKRKFVRQGPSEGRHPHQATVTARAARAVSVARAGETARLTATGIIGRRGILLPVGVPLREVYEPTGARRHTVACRRISRQWVARVIHVCVPTPRPDVRVVRPGIVAWSLTIFRHCSWGI